MKTVIEVDRYGDPACPWDYSSEPSRLRMLWHYSDQLAMTPRMVVLSDTPEDYAKKNFTVDKLERALTDIQRRFGMLIDLTRRARMPGTRLACTAVVAVRRESVARAESFLRRLRGRTMSGALLDDRETIVGACADIGLDFAELQESMADPETQAQLDADWRAARSPTPAALRLDHKLADWEHDGESGRRYTCPSWVFHDPSSDRVVTAPGMQPFESLEVALADVAPSLERRGPPSSATEILDWHEGPIATAEVAALRQVSMDDAKSELEAVGARPTMVGPERFWQ